MQRGHGHDHRNGGGSASGAAGVGHNQPGRPSRIAQWQTPHQNDPQVGGPAGEQTEPDLDLVETAFVEGFADASDPTSFLRLARVPFEATSASGAKLALLRVEIDAVVDVGSVTPHLGGATFRYDPLPASLISRRKRLRFVYFDGQRLRPLDLAKARALAAT